MSTATRKAAPRLPRPAIRYWKGKAPKGIEDVRDSDSESEGGEHEEMDEGDVAIGGEDLDIEEEEEAIPVKFVPAAARTGEMQVKLKDVNISKDGKVIVAGRVESGKTVEEYEEEEEEEEEDQKPPGIGADESSEEESESEEEEEKPALRPVFIPKRARATVLEREQEAQDSEEALKKKEEEAEERRKQSHDLVAETLRRELAEKEKEEEHIDVDDTDGVDPAAEFEAWRLRELNRIKRDKEDEMRREREQEEVERRRALPEAQRMKEDLEHAKKLREDKPKGQQKFLQKYWHKGAFHQDDEVLKKHDYTEATESTVDVSLLPKVMQVRDFGKRSRTKYTHLVDQDTTAGNGGFGGSTFLKRPGGMPPTQASGDGCFLCGGPHLKKDCPQNRTGSNNADLGGVKRSWGEQSTKEGETSSWKERPDGGRRDYDSEAKGRPRDRSRDRGQYRDRDERWDRGDDRDRRREHRYDGEDQRDRRDDRRYSERTKDDRRDNGHRPRPRFYSRSPPRPNTSYREKNGNGRRRSRDRSFEREEGKRRRVD